MNDIEKIEVWALRAALRRWQLFGALAAIVTIAGLVFRYPVTQIAACLVMLVVHLRVMRLWRRLSRLEQFAP